MTIPHHHPHRTDVFPSILRLSALQRLGIAALLSGLVWATILWAMG